MVYFEVARRLITAYEIMNGEYGKKASVYL